MAVPHDFIPRLGVNIDHVATLRQLRGTPYPSLLEAAQIVERAGGQQITVHLREDRRHIQDADVTLLRKHLKVPLNLEMSIAEPIVRFALRTRPAWACLVPEKRQELTTEGGLDLNRSHKRVSLVVSRLNRAKIRTSLFIEPSLKMVRLAAEMGADAVEFHTGTYCGLTQKASPKVSAIRKEVNRIETAGRAARALGLHVHAGHGLDLVNVRALAALEDERGAPLIEEYNIGHSIVCHAVLGGLERAVRDMIAAIAAP